MISSSLLPAAVMSSCIFSQAQGLQVRLSGGWLGWIVDANRGAVPRHGNGRFRFQITRQVFPKLPDADFRGLHAPNLACVHNDSGGGLYGCAKARLSPGAHLQSLISTSKHLPASAEDAH